MDRGPAQQTTAPIESILLGERVRKDMGDLDSLAESIKRHGLLHPIVIKSDNTLVAGQRRIEAARLIGWSEIPVTVIDVEDLLSAERDENAERKDFTPTEAVAIGALIEEEHKAVIAERQHDLRVKANDIKKAKLNGTTDVKNIGGPEAAGKTADTAAKAVGMSPTRYTKARDVVHAADADPDTFGDLPEQMDETGNVAGAHEEMKRRQGKNGAKGRKPRHAVHRGRPYPKPNRSVERVTYALDGICTVLAELEINQLDATKTKQWAVLLKKSASSINAFARRIENVKG